MANGQQVDPIQLLEQLLVQFLDSPPNVQAPPSQVQDPMGRYHGELRRPQRGRGGPRNTENIPSLPWTAEPPRLTRGMIDHSKQGLSDIPISPERQQKRRRPVGYANPRDR